MRIYAAILLALTLFLSAACGARMQSAVQGEWSNVHNDKDKISENARPAPAEKH
ncbi:MAG TPA: hypothetical protein VKT81_04965 [Bryobacteraceae bacterium]|nr:hypothetical protein [Bryobacteraceae bacterium]